MKETKTVESHLECRATAALVESVIEDLSKEDKSLDGLLRKEKKKNDAQDPPEQLPS